MLPCDRRVSLGRAFVSVAKMCEPERQEQLEAVLRAIALADRARIGERINVLQDPSAPTPEMLACAALDVLVLYYVRADWERGALAITSKQQYELACKRGCLHPVVDDDHLVPEAVIDAVQDSLRKLQRHFRATGAFQAQQRGAL